MGGPETDITVGMAGGATRLEATSGSQVDVRPLHLRILLSLLIKAFDLDMSVAPEVGFDLRPRYNVASTQQIAVVRADGERPFISTMRWGLIPSWAKDPTIGNRMINARADGVATKPSFRSALKTRRCLILTDGYYEWQKVGKAKQSVPLQVPDDRPFAFASLWESWRPQKDAEPVESCTIITTDANEAASAYHDRMPVILDAGDCSAWLDPTFDDAARLEPLLRPWERESMVALKVSTAVNNPRNDKAECCEPVS